MNIRSLFGRILDWIFPPSCAGCEKPGTLLCQTCRSELPPVGDHYCPKCGKPLKKGHRCRLCGSSDFRFLSCRAPYLYDGPAAAMIKKLKYNGCLGLVPILADLLADFWPRLGWDADLIIPVPLSRQREAARGFNQSEMIGRAFSKRTGIPILPGALMKIRHTSTQVGLNKDQRRENLSGAFAAEPDFVRGKRILLLDDVMTTGSTFAECASVLLDAGADSVRCLSVATTSAEHGMQNMINAQQRI